MKRFCLTCMILCTFFLVPQNTFALGYRDIVCTPDSARVDENGVYKNNFFGFIFKTPKSTVFGNESDKQANRTIRTGANCDDFLQKHCRNDGNITENTKIELSAEYKSKGDTWYIDGGFGAIITTEESYGKSAKEILEEKINNSVKNTFVNTNYKNFGYFKKVIAGCEYNAGWKIHFGKSNWIQKIYVSVKEGKALIIYIDYSDSNVWDYNKRKYMLNEIEKPYRYSDGFFYSFFLKLNSNPLEIG